VSGAQDFGSLVALSKCKSLGLSPIFAWRLTRELWKTFFFYEKDTLKWYPNAAIEISAPNRKCRPMNVMPLVRLGAVKRTI